MPDSIPEGSQYVPEPVAVRQSSGVILCQVGSNGRAIELWINEREVLNETLGRILIKLGAELLLQRLPKVSIFEQHSDTFRQSGGRTDNGRTKDTDGGTGGSLTGTG